MSSVLLLTHRNFDEIFQCWHVDWFFVTVFFFQITDSFYGLPMSTENKEVSAKQIVRFLTPFDFKPLIWNMQPENDSACLRGSLSFVSLLWRRVVRSNVINVASVLNWTEREKWAQCNVTGANHGQDFPEHVSVCVKERDGPAPSRAKTNTPPRSRELRNNSSGLVHASLLRPLHPHHHTGRKADKIYDTIKDEADAWRQRKHNHHHTHNTPKQLAPQA